MHLETGQVLSISKTIHNILISFVSSIIPPLNTINISITITYNLSWNPQYTNRKVFLHGTGSPVQVPQTLLF